LMTLTAFLSSYTAVASAIKTFSVTIIHPCETAVLTLPTALANFSVAPHSGVPLTQAFMPAVDSKSGVAGAGVASFCGPRVYKIVETTPAAITSIIPPSAGLEYTSAWTLSALTNDCADSGVWTMTLQATLLNYPMVPAVTKVISLTVYHECCSTTINAQTLSPSLTYQLTYNYAPTVLMSFMMNTDSAGVAAGDPLVCGAKKYSTGMSWLAVITPADPTTQ